ncbi:MAG: cation:proton antiporter [Spirochaetales bacterium]|nr:cation:proton antiporter [Spirochaetales bacterium]
MNEIVKSISHWAHAIAITPAFFIGMILFLGTLGARVFQKIHIPQVVGYIFVGIALGASGARVLNAGLVQQLQPFSSFALAVIGFMIGGELKLTTIKKYGKQFTSILFFEALTSFVFVSLMIFVGYYLLTGKPGESVAVALLMGAISSATAPAATTDVLWENRTKGPLTTTVLGIVALDDGLALLLFAFASSIASSLLGTGETHLLLSLLGLLWEIGGALGLGLLTGLVLKLTMFIHYNENRMLLFSIGAILIVLGVSELLHVDMILAAMSLGFYISNFAPLRSKKTFQLVEKITPPIYLLFFVLVGAKLNITIVNPVILVLAAIYLVGRTGGKSLGAFLGALLSRAPKTVQKLLPFCLLSQAGVAIGLSILVGNTFPGPVGNTIALVITLTTFVVQLLGPISVKYAVGKSGEKGLNITEEDLLLQYSAKDLVQKDVPFINEETSISQVLELFSRNDFMQYPVVNTKNDLTGIISIEHLKDIFISYGFSDFLLAFDLKEPVYKTVGPDTPATDIKQLFEQSTVSAIPVVNNDKSIVGIIERNSIQTILYRKMKEMNRRVEQLEKA